MPAPCGCEPDGPVTRHRFGCLECGGPCCPSCAISLESATYCRTCAAELLGAASVRTEATFDLH